MKEKYKRLYKDVQNFINKAEEENKKPLYELTPNEAEKFLIDLQAKDYREITVDIEDTNIETLQAGIVPVRFIRPQNKKEEKLPLILYLHGGGWIMGDEKTHDMLVRKLAVNTNTCIAFVKYTHSPEAAFPQPFNQCYAVLDCLYNNSEKYNIDGNKIILAGDSAGANMAVSCAIKAKNENKDKILFLLLLYPAIDANMKSKSYEKYKDGPWLTKKAMEWFWKAYIQDKSYFKDFYASPISADKDILEGLPQTLIITAENDVLRDEGEKFARKLNKADVKVSCVRILGTCHDFMMLNALSETTPSETAFDIVHSAINKILYA
ncbi:MAG: alpha/beta hydrolase [Candidatus Gastranaerophilales bacterium]|nr:alpha/beta hydrolase [Candidatus Gastranaerophilales bacterium]